ncbi:adenosylcobinamide-GDP ribazoletransferase [Roseibium aggregatum]|uniref:adenosylcobinamide-GDP ribazoletransferase n=1 Tax=Roseibium aggregatum TaxID=187304 RepID=UPI002E293B65|nr:adenosylcobinamide-GDP ribazoletransferase [Roseibium aggregatum]
MTDPALLLADLAACTRFFSRLPLPRLGPSDNPDAAPYFRRVSRAAPLAGVLIALPAALLGLILGLTALPPLATALIVVGTLAATTGALHEDGLADVVDGFFGGGTSERRLEIMKDSRIGTFGALALVLSVALRTILLSALLERFGPGEAMVLFLGAEALSRTLMVWQWSQLPSARPDGLGNRFGRPDTGAAGQAALFGALCLLPSAVALSVPALSLGLILAGIAAHGIGRLVLAKIGGFTGDVLGAVQQITALAFLLGIAMIP